MTEQTYDVMHESGRAPVKMWTKGVAVEDGAKAQLAKAAAMPFIYNWIAVMPEGRQGTGSTVGSAIPSLGAVIPAAVGADIGCGMIAARTSLAASDLPDSLAGLRSAIEQAVPHGRTVGRGLRDKGSWGDPPQSTVEAWSPLEEGFRAITERHPRLKNTNNVVHLGTLGTGNHFIEVCLDEADRV